MVGILHIIKDHADDIALSMVAQQHKDRDVAVLLMQDAVLDHHDLPVDVEVFASRSDVEARGLKSKARLLDYGEIVDLIFDSEKVVCW